MFKLEEGQKRLQPIDYIGELYPGKKSDIVPEDKEKKNKNMKMKLMTLLPPKHILDKIKAQKERQKLRRIAKRKEKGNIKK